MCWLLSWHCKNVTNAGHIRHGWCTKAGVKLANEVCVVLCSKLYLADMGMCGSYRLGLDLDLISYPAPKSKSEARY